MKNDWVDVDLRQLNVNEWNCPTNDMELIAMVFAMNMRRCYLYGAKLQNLLR